MVAGPFDDHAPFVGSADFIFEQFGAGALYVPLYVTRAGAKVGTIY